MVAGSAFLTILILAPPAAGAARELATRGERSLVELKITIDPAEIDGALLAFHLRPRDASASKIYFYDSPALSLYRSGVILRARENDSETDDDATVKIRPLTEKDVDPRWFERSGFKCEIDRVIDQAAPTCSLTVSSGEGDIGAVAGGKRPIRTLYSPAQRRFLSRHFASSVDWAALRVLGPVDALEWKVDREEFEKHLHVELWAIGSQVRILEFSVRVAQRDAETAERDLERLLAERGLDPSVRHDTKTKIALEYLARQASLRGCSTESARNSAHGTPSGEIASQSATTTQ